VIQVGRCVMALAAGRDIRISLLAQGAAQALAWLTDPEMGSPLLMVTDEMPDRARIREEADACVQAVAGRIPVPRFGWSDNGRIFAFGAWELLVWIDHVGYPDPVWMLPSTDPDVVRRYVLRDVGVVEGAQLTGATFGYAPRCL
jgi:hypothetical protein